jgi:hypothetical protein
VENAPEQPDELLALWRRPGGVLSREQTRALLAWDGTPSDVRPALEADLATMEQSVDPRPLAPNERRGHNSFLDRLRGLFR